MRKEGRFVWLRWTLIVAAAAVLAIVARGLSPTPAHAASKSWSGAIDGNWTTAANWTPAGVPANGDDLTFPCGAPQPNNNNNSAVTTLHSITFSGAAPCAFTIAGSAIALTGPLSDTAASGTNTVTLALSGAAGSLSKAGAATLVLTGAAAYGGATVTSGGILRLGAAQTFAATTVTSPGSLDLNNAALTVSSLAGNGAVALGSATLTVGDPTSTTYSGSISGAGGLTKIGAGVLTVSGLNALAYTGPTSVNAGILRMGAAQSLHATTVTLPGALELITFNVAVSSLSGTGSVNLGTATLTVGDATSTIFSGSIAGAGGLTKTGTGTLELSGSLTYAGATTITGGSLQVDSVPASTLITISSGTLVFGVATNVSYGGTIQGAGGLTKTGAGTLALTGSLTYTGLTAVNVGALELVGPKTINPITIAGGAIVVFNEASNTSYAGTISGLGGLTKIGLGTLTLTGAVSYTGPTAINVGILQFATAATVGSMTIAGGTLDVNGVVVLTVTTLGGSGPVTLTGGTLSTSDGNFSGPMSGTGGLTKYGAGTLVVSGTLGYGGATTINGGILQLGAPETLQSAIITAGTLDMNNHALTLASLSGAGTLAMGTGTLTVDSGSFSGGTTGTGSFIKNGPGMLTLLGPTAHTGATTINGGTLTLGGAEDLHATTVAAGATLNVTGQLPTAQMLFGAGSLTMGPNSQIRIGGDSIFSGIISGDGSAKVAVVGPGSLTLSNNNNFTPFPGTINVIGGELVITGQSPANLITVADRTVLAGNPPGGHVSGVVSVGRVRPGRTLRAVMNCTDMFNLKGGGGSQLSVEIDGPGAGSGFDQLNCIGSNGRVGLGENNGLSDPRPDLDLHVGANVPIGTYPIVHADGGVLGTFAGLPNGSTLTVNGQLFYITYSAKDVMVTRVSGGRYMPVSPFRQLDTRQSGQRLGPNSSLDLQVLGTGGDGGVPATGVSAVVVNVTAVAPSNYSYLTVYPTGPNSRPLASNLNFGPYQTIANLVTVPVGLNGSISFYNSEGSVDVLADIQGWYTGSPEGGNAGLFKPLSTPTRILDTRPGSRVGPYSSPMPPDSTITIQVGLIANVPASATAAVLNVTPVNGSAYSYLTVFPEDVAKPVVSNVNFPPGRNLPNRVMVKLSAPPAAGQVNIYNSEGYVDVVVDLAGWFTDHTDSSGALFHPLTPTRVLDTRDTQSPVGPDSSIAVPIVGSPAPVPPGAVAVVGNGTVTNPTAGSFLTVYPTGPTPLISDLNFGPGDTIPNLVVTRMTSDGKVNIYNNQGSVDVLFDVSGYYG